MTRDEVEPDPRDSDERSAREPEPRQTGPLGREPLARESIAGDTGAGNASAGNMGAEDTAVPGHRRRPRYSGTHPRRFGEKYKELDPARYPEMIEHVRGRGRTPAGQHVSILVEEVLSVLAPRSGERGVDATLGFGGHAERFLAALAPAGRLLGLDADPIELPKTEARLRALGHGEDRLVVRRTNFAGLASALHDDGFRDGVGFGDGVDFVFADLGVSSMQIDDPARGFTFKLDGPLDMRMNPARGLSAAQWLERATVESLAAVLEAHADEPHAARLARAIVARSRSSPRPMTNTRELADLVRGALNGVATEEAIDKSVRRVFQALRIEVNDELRALDALLRQLPDVLRPGGRAAILTFHSGEDRRVKKSFERGVKDGVYAATNDEVIRASPEEQRANPRSTSAKLRWVRKA